MTVALAQAAPVVLVWLLNLGFATYHAAVAGRTWMEAKECGGYRHVMAWVSALVSAGAFTCCVTGVKLVLAGWLGWHGATKYTDLYVRAGTYMLLVQVVLLFYVINVMRWVNNYDYSHDVLPVRAQMSPAELTFVVASIMLLGGGITLTYLVAWRFAVRRARQRVASLAGEA